MAVCLVDQGAQSYPVWFPPEAPDADCPGYVLVQRSDMPALTALPEPAEAATAFALAFSLVVGSYAIGWAVGAVVNFINRN